MKYTVYDPEHAKFFIQGLTLREAASRILKKFEIRQVTVSTWWLYVWDAPSYSFYKEDVFWRGQTREEAEEVIFTEICKRSKIYSNFEVLTDDEFLKTEYYLDFEEDKRKKEILLDNWLTLRDVMD